MRRAYKQAVARPEAQGYILTLDGKPARTPAGRPLLMFHVELALAVALEWQAQGETIRRETMPLTQLTCAAIDLLSDDAQRKMHSDQLLVYAETDLVCYRAGDIPELAARQAELLDPIAAWAEARLGIALAVTDGLMPVSQPPENRAKLALALEDYDQWKFAGLAACVRPLSSLVLALALVEGRIDAEAAYHLSHLEELYETEKWGREEEKEKRLHAVREDLLHVQSFLKLLMF